MHEISVAGGGDIDGDSHGDEGDDEEVDWRSGCLGAEDFAFRHGAGGGVFVAKGVVGAVEAVLVAGESGGVSAWEEIRDGDCEFRAEKEG